MENTVPTACDALVHRREAIFIEDYDVPRLISSGTQGSAAGLL